MLIREGGGQNGRTRESVLSGMNGLPFFCTVTYRIPIRVIFFFFLCSALLKYNIIFYCSIALRGVKAVKSSRVKIKNNYW